MTKFHKQFAKQIGQVANARAVANRQLKEQGEAIDTILAYLSQEDSALTHFEMYPSFLNLSFKTFNMRILNDLAEILNASPEADEDDSNVFWVHGKALTLYVEYEPVIDQQLQLFAHESET